MQLAYPVVAHCKKRRMLACALLRWSIYYVGNREPITEAFLILGRNGAQELRLPLSAQYIKLSFRNFPRFPSFGDGRL